MKKIFLFFFLIFILALPCHAAEPDLRGVWVSSVYNLDYPTSQNLSQEELKKEIDEIIYSVADAGLNTIFLQVRPECDAIYPSKIFPWSKYISGTQGLAPEGSFDSLAYFISAAHLRGIELHAWINPYRITVSSFESIDEGLASLCDSHPAKLNPQWVKHGSDKKLYLDPAISEVRSLILDGIIELAENYDIDGIHLDDYFYPDGVFDDYDSYITYGGQFENIEDFRRNNVNEIVRSINSTCKEYGLTFGISPFGIWANYIYNEHGSLTAGNQSYYSHYADSRLWVKEGWVDYIAPQLYWAIGSDEGEFEKLLLWWRDVVSGTGVNLYIGLASYRSIEANEESIWYDGAEIIRQLKMIDMYGQTDGVIFFRYQTFVQTKPLKNYTSQTFTFPMPEIGQPIFLKASKELNVYTPTVNKRIVSNISFDVICNAPSNSTVYAMTDFEFSKLRRTDEGLYAQTTISDKSGITFVCDRSGFISIKSIGVTLLSSKIKNSLVDIDWKVENDYTVLTFYTDYPATSKTYINGEYSYLEISPARVGLVFECDNIRAMVCEKFDGYVRYIFDMYKTPAECFAIEHDNRIEVYIK